MVVFCNYIYLDSKIIGIAKQTITFYDYGIFHRENTIVLLKKYKHSSNQIIKKMLLDAGIKCHIVKMGDIDALEGGVIFYPFNAQSNTRVVANRKLKHIFITHGESSKISSVKPIIRIYDYIATAGQAGIDRFIAHKIFDFHDIELGRLIKMGDTFIGRTGLSRDQKGAPCILYAPTWEGGIPTENYSSLECTNEVYELLRLLAQKYQTQQIIIRPHPNTGHRLKNYRQHLCNLIKRLIETSLNVIVYSKNFHLTLGERWKLRKYNIKFTDDLSNYKACFGLCDISAMETQMLNEDIPYYLYWNSTKQPNALWAPKFYRPISQINTKLCNTSYWEIDPEYMSVIAFKDYVIDAEMTKYPTDKKIDLLLHNLKIN